MLARASSLIRLLSPAAARRRAGARANTSTGAEEPAAEVSEDVATGVPVAGMQARRAGPQEWNLWELERLARAGAHRHPERSEEWAYLFVHLRQFADPDGALPPEFDSLVRESFAELLEASGRA